MKKNFRRAFTIVELVIVIAVIAVLASVLIPTFSGVVQKANESKAMQDAKNKWNDISYYYISGYEGFKLDNGCMNGWYYDYEDDIAKYDYEEKYTVTYDGVEFIVNTYDGVTYDEVETASVDYKEYYITEYPYALNITYYTNIYTRGFSYITNMNVDSTELYIVESNLGEQADFDNSTYTCYGSCETVTYEGGNGNVKSDINYGNIETTYTDTTNISNYTFKSHKVHVEELSPSTTYSYKIGADSYYSYGVFRTAASNITSITAIQLSDAQTLNPGSLNKWENTLAQAVETAGNGLDFILYNGDQFDQRMWSADNSGIASPISRIERYAIARETVSEYVGTTPYMSSSGNHEPFAPYSHYLMNDINYGYDSVSNDGYAETGAYYSYDYGFAHFVVLNSNDMSDEQLEWLEDDLSESQTAKWIIVMIHFGPYATGDHLSGAKSLTEKVTPIFAEYHVDLVLQAHDHTYNKTLAYSWGTDKGYCSKDAIDDVISEYINTEVETVVYNGVTYDKNPNGTYYVTTGAAGHRVGEDGNTFVNNYDTNSTYKLICGTIDVDSSYANIGDTASANLEVQMFGVLNLTENTLTYDFYVVDGDNVELFDTLNIYKTN